MFGNVDTTCASLSGCIQRVSFALHSQTLYFTSSTPRLHPQKDDGPVIITLTHTNKSAPPIAPIETLPLILQTLASQAASPNTTPPTPHQPWPPHPGNGSPTPKPSTAQSTQPSPPPTPPTPPQAKSSSSPAAAAASASTSPSPSTKRAPKPSSSPAAARTSSAKPRRSWRRVATRRFCSTRLMSRTKWR